MKRQRAKIGRPPKLDMATVVLFIEGLRRAGTVAEGARVAGVHRTTAMRWLARGREGKEPYRELLELVTEVRRLSPHRPRRARRVPRRHAAGVQSICTGPDPAGG